MDWRPILDGAAAERAIDLASSIARGLAGASRGLRDAEVALLAAYAERDRFATRPEGVATAAPNVSLYQGSTGFAWVLAHLDDGAPRDHDDSAGLDQLLIDAVERDQAWPEFDLTDGLVGLGVHALERLPRPRARRLLTSVIDRLEDQAHLTRDGAFWWTPPDLLSPARGATYPDGYADLGLAHGTAGVIALLGRAAGAGVEPARASVLAEAAIAWLSAQRLPDAAPSSFPTWVAPGQTPLPARAAWCHGDPGIAAALLLAADGCGRDDWRRRAIDLARRAARRPPRTAGAFDGGFCHGTSGLGHIFNRLHQATGDEPLLLAARAWLEETLRGPGPDSRSCFPWTAAVALALLAAATPVAPGWDRMFLLSA